MHKFTSGALRKECLTERYDFVCPLAFERLAKTYHEGALTYGDFNWCKGLPLFDVFNHVIKHLFLWIRNDNEEDHLAHAAWGIFALMHFESKCKHHEGTQKIYENDPNYIKKKQRTKK